MKTDFELDIQDSSFKESKANIKIHAKHVAKPYVKICFDLNEEYGLVATAWIKDNDLEEFAVNILKVLKSKHLKTKK